MPKKGVGKGGGGGGGGGDKRLQMFDVIKKPKLEGVRWSFLYGGQQVSTRDDEGLTPLMVCALDNKHRAMDNILENLGHKLSKRGGSSVSEAGEAIEGLELADDEGKTALMMACMTGNMQCAKFLVKAGAHVHQRDSEGRNARWYAEVGKYWGIMNWIDEGAKVDEQRSESEDEEDEQELLDGESKTARNRRLRREREAKETGTAYGDEKDEEEEVIEEELQSDKIHEKIICYRTIVQYLHSVIHVYGHRYYIYISDHIPNTNPSNTILA